MCSSTRSERWLSLSVSFVFLRDGVTLWVKCVLHTLLLSIEGLPSAGGSCSFRVLLLAPCFHLVVHHRLPLCYSSLPCVASFCSVGFFLLASIPCFAVLCPWPLVILLALLRSFHLVRPLSLSLFLSCPSLRSLGGRPVPSWPYVVSLASASLWVLAQEVLSSCLGLQLLVFEGSWLSPHVFLSGHIASLSSLSGSLARSGYPVCPLPRSFLSGLERLCVSSAGHAPSFSYPCFTVISLVLPLSLRVLALSLCLLALLFVLFLGRSLLLLAVSFLLLPRLPLRLFLPLLCLLRRGLMVCLLLRLHRRLRVLLPCPLFWLLPLGLPSGFHPLLSFCCTVLLLAWFSWGPVVPARVVVLFFYMF